jgi:tetratricopeptide (TPR) repeat protein
MVTSVRRGAHSGGRSDLGWGLFLLAVTIVVFAPSVGCGYIWDDDQYVQNNQTLRSFDGLLRIWFASRSTPQYYPLVFSSYWLEYRLWGDRPAGYHLVNILLHAAGAVLLWRILIRLGVTAAWFAAAAYAVHPVQLESVAWVTERKNVLCGLFYFGSALVFLRWSGIGAGGGATAEESPHHRRGKDKSKVAEPAPASSECHTTSRAGSGEIEPRESTCRRAYILSVVLFVCALLSKTVACTLPAALLLVLWWKRGRFPRKDLPALGPMFAIGIAMGLVTAYLEKHHVGAVGQEWGLSLLERCLLAGRIICFYAGKVIWPHPLIFIYSRWQISSADWQQYLYPAGFLVAVAVLWAVRRRIGAGPLVAVLFFAGTLFPALGFFDVYPMRFSYVADHFQYLASVGMIVLAVAAGHRLLLLAGRRSRPIMAVVGAGILAVFGGMIWTRTPVYENEETLWRDTLARNGQAWIACNNLGHMLQNRNPPRLQEAEAFYRQALEMRREAFEAYHNLGAVLLSEGKAEEAIGYYRRAMELAPKISATHHQMGKALNSLGKADEALGYYRGAVEISPSDAALRCALAEFLQSVGKTDEAAAEFREALKLDPNQPQALCCLGLLLQSEGRVEEAVGLFKNALRVDPNFANAHFALGTALQLQNKLDQAILSYRQALRFKPDFAQVHYMLGAALEVQGRPAEALGHYQQALQGEPNWTEPMVRAAWLLATQADSGLGRPDQAVQLAERAAQLTQYKEAPAMDTLGVAYSATGQFERAISAGQRALELATAAGDARLAEQVRVRLGLYAQGIAYRAPRAARTN